MMGHYGEPEDWPTTAETPEPPKEPITDADLAGLADVIRSIAEHRGCAVPVVLLELWRRMINGKI